MSPSKPLRYGDLTLLQKLDEVGSSVKVERQTSTFVLKVGYALLSRRLYLHLVYFTESSNIT